MPSAQPFATWGSSWRALAALRAEHDTHQQLALIDTEREVSSRSLAVSFLLFARARHIDLLVELDNRFNGRFENVNETPYTDATPTATGTRHTGRAGSATPGAGGIGDRRGRDRRPARPVAAEQEPPQEDRLRDARARACDHANPRLARNRSAGTQVRTPLIHSDPG